MDIVAELRLQSIAAQQRLEARRNAVAQLLAGSSPPPAHNIDKVIEKLQPGLKPLKGADGYIYNDTHIAALCNKQHLHQYLISDVLAGKVTCITCSLTGSLATVRDQLEYLTKRPFIVSINGNHTVKFVSLKLKILVEITAAASAQSGGSDTADTHEGWTVLRIQNTITNIEFRLWRLLNAARPEVIVRQKVVKNFACDPPAIVPALARHTKAYSNVVDDEHLYLENC